MSRRYVIALGWQTKFFSHLSCHLPSFLIPTPRWVMGFCRTQYWYTLKSASLTDLRRTLMWSNVLARQAALAYLMQGCIGGGYKATDASARGECSEDGWLPCDSEAPLSWWFSDRVVSFSLIPLGLTLLGWVKSSIG